MNTYEDNFSFVINISENKVIFNSDIIIFTISRLGFTIAISSSFVFIIE